ncbi:DUF222 domain-containing protein [Lentzea rhizosphaerae]|uniref:DUF222 domain-containing protein n=1 Tax=Lentzea rhizosphaerae TaxID=2041025 RepID=A0ABV8BK49_9PSEU
MIETRLLPTDELLRSVVSKVTEIRVREHELMQEIAELDRRGAATELGYKDLAQVLRHAVRWDLTTAKKWVATAARLSGAITPTGSELQPELPATAVAVAEGALSIEHVAVVAKAMETLPAEAEAPLVDYARDHEPNEVRKFGEDLLYRLYQNDPAPGDTEPAPPGNEHIMRWKNGRLEIRAKLDKVTGAKYEALIDPLAKPRPNTADEGPDLRSREQREGDALADLIDLMLRADQLPEHGGEPVTLTLTMPYEDLANQVGHATLDNGDRVPAEQVRQFACNAGIIPMVLGGAGQPLDVGRKTRTFPAAIRRILVTRDRGCAFPGCGRPPRQCDAHHIRHWADGGDTSVDNAVLLCRHHHTLIHQSKWEVKLVTGIPTFYPPAWLDPQQRPRRNLINTA